MEQSKMILCGRVACGIYMTDLGLPNVTANHVFYSKVHQLMQTECRLRSCRKREREKEFTLTFSGSSGWRIKGHNS